MSSVVSIGVIGCGEIAQVMHLHYLRDLPGFALRAVCDLSPARVSVVGERFGVPAERRFTDPDAILACSDLDGILILTNGSHAAIARAALAAGKHVFVEKPMCVTLADADTMVAMAREVRRILMVGYMKAYDPTYESARDLWRSMIGELNLVRITDICHDNRHAVEDLYGPIIVRIDGTDVPPDMLDRLGAEGEAERRRALGEGAPEAAIRVYGKLLGLLTHDTSILMLAFGPPRRVLSANVWDSGNGLAAALDYGSFVCTIETARGGQNWMEESITAYGTTRHAALVFPSPYQRNGITTLVVRENAGSGYVEHRHVASLAEAFQRELEHFRGALLGGDTPRTDGAVGRDNIALAQAIVQRAFPGLQTEARMRGLFGSGE